MQDAFKDLGRRIVEAARLAADVHLREHTDEAARQQTPGGAGDASMDGVLSLRRDRGVRSTLYVERRAG